MKLGNKSMQNKIIVSGITATGELTIGNYIGAISNFLELQKNNQLYIFVANLHAITGSFQPLAIARNIRNMVALYYACGLTPKHTKIFLQSDVKAHAQLAHILLCHTTIGELSRMTQFKDKNQKYKAKNGSQYIPTGILTYPCLMAADILIYDADYVPVGKDQKQHIELTRNIALRMNKKYKKDIFTLPAELTPTTGAKIMDLQNPAKKMSKSSEDSKTYIALLDDYKTITSKIKKAVTDSENKVYYDAKNKPGISNLMVIYSSFAGLSLDEVALEFSNSNYGIFKQAVIDAIWKILQPIQEKYRIIMDDDAKLNQLIHTNAAFMNKIANQKLNQVENILGLNGSATSAVD